MENFGWLSLLPPVIAIVLALITKQVYASLFIGIFAGSLIYANFNPLLAIINVFEIMTDRIGGNAYIIIFLVALGMVVALVSKAGGSKAYGKWAGSKIKSRPASLLATSGLGALIFVDDYFNCLTVGSVMRPITDSHKVSRAKLAYIIDATAAPICIIAPISSWAAAVASSLPEDSSIDGFNLFIRTIPYNFYAILTLIMLVIMALWQFDYGPMKKHELNAVKNNDLFSSTDSSYSSEEEGKENGSIWDLVVPIVALIAFCVTGMLYTGGFFSGVDFITAFADCNASLSLVLGSTATLFLMFLLYIPRKVISFTDFSDSVITGFRAMVPAVAILVMAWTLSGITNESLGAGSFVESVVGNSASTGIGGAVLPAIMFIIALGLAFATGTSWGTFAILVPIAVGLFPEMQEILVISVSAILAGAVCGDHCSPISDTTIMASAGAQCNHINHVSTQLPYALTVAAVSIVGYIIAGITQNVWISLPVSIVLLVVTLVVLRSKFKDKETKQA